MRIYIEDKNKQRNIFLPMNFLSKLISYSVCKKMDARQKKSAKTAIKKAVKILKKYKKENGSFTLVEVEEKDGAKVKITV